MDPDNYKTLSAPDINKDISFSLKCTQNVYNKQLQNGHSLNIYLDNIFVRNFGLKKHYFENIRLETQFEIWPMTITTQLTISMTWL